VPFFGSFGENYSIANDTVEGLLLSSPGKPVDWSIDDVEVYGLVDSSDPSTSIEARIVDADKLVYMIHNSVADYEGFRRSLLGTSKYDISFRVSCVNESRVGCFQGIPLQTVSDNVVVECVNGFEFSVTDGGTDSRVWFEVEEAGFWGGATLLYCGSEGRECSGF